MASRDEMPRYTRARKGGRYRGNEPQWDLDSERWSDDDVDLERNAGVDATQGRTWHPGPEPYQADTRYPDTYGNRQARGDESEPLRSGRRWPEGFYTGENGRKDSAARARLGEHKPKRAWFAQDKREERMRNDHLERDRWRAPEERGAARENFHEHSAPTAYSHYPQAPALSHRGRGPKGFRRSDARLQEIICERLTDDEYIDASDIAVSVQDGAVTLEGTVPDRGTKYAVEELVEQCGARDIHNRLRVGAANSAGTAAKHIGAQADHVKGGVADTVPPRLDKDPHTSVE